MASDPAIATGEIRLEVKGSIGLITLDRPKALNALTQAMCLAIDEALLNWASDPAIAAVVVRGEGDRAFCAGGDVRTIYDKGLALKRGLDDGQLLRSFFRDEYRMNWRIKNFPKPYIALIDKITMGGGLGLSVHGSHRIASERTILAMPETRIGLFPDVGTSFTLPRTPGEFGTFLALSGFRIKAADAIAAGLATHCVPSRRLDDLLEDLISADWSLAAPDVVNGVLEHYAVPAGDPEVLPHRPLIDRCFAYDRVEEILKTLDAEGTPFASDSAATIRTMSPTSLKLTLAEMRRGRTLDFDACLAMEYRLTQSVLAEHDFYEGIRAALVDKDHHPKWMPATLETVEDSTLDRYFAVPPGGDLTFLP